MGNKGKDKKKGKGAEKTKTKTDKKLLAKQKKLLAKIGEADIEQLVAQYEIEEQEQQETTENIISPPSSRVNFSICPHPDKDEIIIFGGEHFDGQKTTIFNDFYIYNIAKNEWKLLKSPAGKSPTPRSGHQMLSIATDGGQLWLFGGEYASPSQLQFYHFRDLWVFRLKSRKWEKINALGGPGARSGHRMVTSKKRLIVFGGFHDNNQSYKYFNDVHIFSLETYTWQKIEPAGCTPPPRSGCCMVVGADGKILIWGGYSKSSVKKEIDRGVTHTDMFQLTEDIKEKVPWKWSSIKPGGMRPIPRSGMSVAVAPSGKAYVFGGVLDVEEDEENLQGQFSNDVHSLDLVNRTWRIVDICKKEKSKKRKDGSNDVDMDNEDLSTENVEAKTVTTDGVFTMIVGNSKATSSSENKLKSSSNANQISPRMNSGMTVQKGNLYIFGGIVEEGHKQFTLCDFYSLDLHKLDSWKTIISNEITSKDWLGSDSEESSDSSDEDSDDDDDDDEDDSSEMDTD